MSRSDVPRRARLDLRANVAPERAAPPAHGTFVWTSLVLVWLISLMPWRVWSGAPDMLLLTLAFWCIQQPSRVGLLAAFVFGLLMDVHDGGLMGELALNYVLVAYGAVVLQRRLQRFDLLSQAIHLLPVFVGAKFLIVVLHAWLSGQWPGWHWALGVLLTVGLYPVFGWLLLLPLRGDDDDESSSA